MKIHVKWWDLAAVAFLISLQIHTKSSEPYIFKINKLVSSEHAVAKKVSSEYKDWMSSCSLSKIKFRWQNTAHNDGIEEMPAILAKYRDSLVELHLILILRGNWFFKRSDSVTESDFFIL